jgi:hypothetical protein
MNAHAKRFVRSIQMERLDQMTFVQRALLERVIGEYSTHNHGERSHQIPSAQGGPTSRGRDCIPSCNSAGLGRSRSLVLPRPLALEVVT